MPRDLIRNGELVLYGPVGGDWWGESGFTDEDVLANLEEMSGDIIVRINSGGGIAFQGIAIQNALKAFDGSVTAYVDALAASAASIIAMGADRLILRDGAMLMIHDPSTIAWGDSRQFRKHADRLDTLAAQGASIYSRRSGLPIEDVRQMMRDETWLGAEEAIAKGLADAEAGIEDEATMQAPIFDYSLYRHPPERFAARIPAAARGPRQEAIVPQPNQTGQGPASGAEPTQTTKAPAPEVKQEPTQSAAPSLINPPAPSQPQRPERQALDNDAIMQRADAAGLDLKATREIIQASTSNEDAYMRIIDTVAERQGPEPRNHAQVTADERDRFRQGVEQSLLAKVGLEGGERNEFSSLSMMELARASLAKANIDVRGVHDRMELAGAAFAPMMVGMGSTSDFPHILENIARKSMLKGYDEVEETFEAWTSRGSLSDFKISKRVDINTFPSLKRVEEGEEYSYATIGDRGVMLALATYGRMFSITRQTIINDDLSALGRVPRKMGRAARRTVGNLVYAVLVDNPKFVDDVALFHADHKNLGAGAAPSIATFQAASTAMMLQEEKNEDGELIKLGIRPRFVINGPQTQWTIKSVLEAEADPDGKHAKVPNTVRGMVAPITEHRIADGRYVFAADPAMHDTVEVSYLDGNDRPYLENRVGWSIDGTEWKVRIDAGVNPLDFRALYMNPGA